MDPAVDEFLPKTRHDFDSYQSIQSTVRDRASFVDNPTLATQEPTEMTVVGIDQAITDDEIISAAVAMQNGTVIDTAIATCAAPIPYVPGYLSFREGPSVVAALDVLDAEPDLLLIDGNGRLHPRQAGLATHVGVVRACPTIGVAKSLLCGSLEDPPAEPWSVGTTVRITQSGATDVPETFGYAVQTRQWENRRQSINPVYVSPGHLCGARQAVDLVMDFLDGYKLPEPIRRADHRAGTHR